MAPSIDKIRLYLPRTGATPDISQYLDNAMERTCRATGEVVVSGDIDGLSVYSHSGGYSVIGSLPKFLNGNNIFPLDMDSVRLAFEKMSDAFHTSVEGARVTSIEYGANLILRKSPKVYMGKFGNMPRMPIRMVTPNSVYYQTRGEHPSMRRLGVTKICPQNTTYYYRTKNVDGRQKTSAIGKVCGKRFYQ